MSGAAVGGRNKILCGQMTLNKLDLQNVKGNPMDKNIRRKALVEPFPANKSPGKTSTYRTEAVSLRDQPQLRHTNPWPPRYVTLPCYEW